VHHDDLAALVAMRKEKDDWFKRSPHSPLDASARASFKGLRYFDPAPAFRVKAKLERAAGHKHVMMATSTGEFKDYHLAGTLRFRVGDVEQTLLAYVSHGREEEMFVPFRDATSGNESYGAARYLEVATPQSDDVVVDFNYAYNPYCAYSEMFSCPLPPHENWLTVPIRAGERAYEAE
jgi:uncharacterized protein